LRLGEDVTEVLDCLPGSFHVTRHVRPKLSSRNRESIAQAPVPGLPIEAGLATPSLLLHVLVAKYCDHLPRYRQAEIYAHTAAAWIVPHLLTDWAGQTVRLMRPLVEGVSACNDGGAGVRK
jgi:transposase